MGEWQEGGVDMDYSKLENVPIILANLADKDFIPEANTYYEHLGETTENFIKGVIYFYDGTEYKAIDGSGSGAGVQPDYNQNDSTQPDYIKNRPFYAEMTSTEVANFRLISGNLKEDGSEVTVDYNGESYTGTVENVGDMNDPRYVLNIDAGEQGFICEIDIQNEQTTFIIAHKKTYEIKANDEVVFNGVNYSVKVATSDNAAGILYISDGEINFETGKPISASFVYAFELKKAANLVVDQYLFFYSTADIEFNLKVNQETVKTIEPKFIKDMYYETTTETELFNGVEDINTEEASSGETYYTGTLSPSFTVGVTGDKCEVSIDGNIYTLDVVALLGHSFAGIRDFSNGIPVYVATVDNVTTIGSKTSFMGANVVIKNIHTDIKQIPPKYISEVGYTMTIEIAGSEYSDSGIATAIKNYLTNNVDALEKIKTVNSFDLVLIVDGMKWIFRFVDNFDDAVMNLFGRFFVCLFYGQEDFFNTNKYLYEKIVKIIYQDEIEVEFKSGVVYDSNIKFGVAPLKTAMGDVFYDFGGKLGFFTLNSDQGDKYIPDGNIVSLSEWITLAQQRDDFAIPAPTKDTDLVDKKYVNNAISTAVTNAITTALNTEV